MLTHPGIVDRLLFHIQQSIFRYHICLHLESGTRCSYPHILQADKSRKEHFNRNSKSYPIHHLTDNSKWVLLVKNQLSVTCARVNYDDDFTIQEVCSCPRLQIIQFLGYTCICRLHVHKQTRKNMLEKVLCWRQPCAKRLLWI